MLRVTPAEFRQAKGIHELERRFLVRLDLDVALRESQQPRRVAPAAFEDRLKSRVLGFGFRAAALFFPPPLSLRLTPTFRLPPEAGLLVITQRPFQPLRLRSQIVPGRALPREGLADRRGEFLRSRVCRCRCRSFASRPLPAAIMHPTDDRTVVSFGKMLSAAGGLLDDTYSPLRAVAGSLSRPSPEAMGMGLSCTPGW